MIPSFSFQNCSHFSFAYCLIRIILDRFVTGDKESATSWREMFNDLKRRGLDASRVQLGIMDGLPGLERVFKEEFTKAKVQRCRVHVARNVLAKVPTKLKKDVADQVRSIFYASSKSKAIEFFESFKAEREKRICLQR